MVVEANDFYYGFMILKVGNKDGIKPFWGE